MNMDTLSNVKFGDVDSLQEMLFENAQQHKLFWETLTDEGLTIPAFPITEANPDNLDDWLQIHQVEHQAFAAALNLDNPFNLLDTDWNVEADFYDWLQSHLYIHQLIAAQLGFNDQGG